MLLNPTFAKPQTVIGNGFPTLRANTDEQTKIRTMKQTLTLFLMLISFVGFSQTEGKSLTELEPIKNHETGKWGYIDRMQGNLLVIDFKYDFAEPFSEDLALVILNGKFGFIDSTGKEVVPAVYDYFGKNKETRTYFFDGVMIAIRDGKYGMIDKKTGKEITPMVYDDFSYNYDTGNFLIIAERNGKYGVLDTTGKEIVPVIYDEFEWHGSIVEQKKIFDGFIKAKLNDKWMIIDLKGKVVVPDKYDEIVYNSMYETYFYKGLFKVKLNGKYGFVNQKGKLVVPCKYDSKDIVICNCNGVYIDGDIYLIDENGKLKKEIPLGEKNSTGRKE